MNTQREEVSGNLCTLLAVLFLFFICLFSSTSESKANRGFKYELSADSHSTAVAETSDITVTFYESIIPFCKKFVFNPFNQDCKIFADNRDFNQQLIFLSKVELRIKPIVSHGYFYRYSHMDTEDVPPLS